MHALPHTSPKRKRGKRRECRFASQFNTEKRNLKADDYGAASGKLSVVVLGSIVWM